jgi:hypothetical protein
LTERLGSTSTLCAVAMRPHLVQGFGWKVRTPRVSGIKLLVTGRSWGTDIASYSFVRAWQDVFVESVVRKARMFSAPFSSNSLPLDVFH